MISKIRTGACVTAAIVWALGMPGAGAADKVKPRKGMKLPPELATGAVEMRVQKHKRLVLPDKTVPLLIEFGPWRVTDFERGWIHGSGQGWGIGSVGVGGGHSSQRYHFTVTSSAAPDEPAWACACETQGSGGSIGVGSGLLVPLGGHGRLACELHRGEGGEIWQLDVRTRAKGGLIPSFEAAGRVKSGEKSVLVEGTDRYARTPGIGAQLLTGFVLTLDGRPSAAADITREAALLLAPDAPAELESPLAAAGAALLLFQDLTGR